MKGRNQILISGTVIAFIVVGLMYFQTIAKSATVLSAPTQDTPPLPTDPNLPRFFPIEELGEYPYCESAYLHYAKLYPDSHCATWANGGLSWFYAADLTEDATIIQGGWGVVLWTPIWRFCGIPAERPELPEKPEDPTLQMPPKEWLNWKIEIEQQTEAP